MEQVAKFKRTWNLTPILQIVPKILENYCSCMHLSMGQVWRLNELWFKRYLQNCTLTDVRILIMTYKYSPLDCLKTTLDTLLAQYNPANIYLFKANNRNTRKGCEICSKLTIKTREWRHWRLSGVFLVNFEHISNLFLVFLLLALNK